MKNILAMIVAGTALLSVQAMADDSMSPPTTAQKHQMMKDCMHKQMAMNTGMSKPDMRKACTDQMNAPKDPTATVGSGGPATTPNSH